MTPEEGQHGEENIVIAQTHGKDRLWAKMIYNEIYLNVD